MVDCGPKRIYVQACMGFYISGRQLIGYATLGGLWAQEDIRASVHRVLHIK